MCGREDKGGHSTEEKNDQTETESPPPDPCENYRINSTGCNVTIQGQLLLALDFINSSFRDCFASICEEVKARLIYTSVTTEILDAWNQTSCSDTSGCSKFDRTLLKQKLTNLSKLEQEDGNAGMAVIFTDRGLTSSNFSMLSENNEPFLYFVNVGENENRSGSCYRQYRYVDNETDINEIARELETIGCNSTDYMNNNCLPRRPVEIPGQAGSMSSIWTPVILSAGGGVLLTAALIVVLFVVLVRKCKRQERPRMTMKQSMECSVVVYSQVDGQGASRYSMAHPSYSNGIYNELREDEKRTNDDELPDNYHHLDITFVQDNVYPSMYDHVTVRGDSNKDSTEPG